MCNMFGLAFVQEHIEGCHQPWAAVHGCCLERLMVARTGMMIELARDLRGNMLVILLGPCQCLNALEFRHAHLLVL